VELRHVRRSVQEVVSLEDDVKLRTTTQWLVNEKQKIAH
jgi:hypothetical protein